MSFLDSFLLQLEDDKLLYAQLKGFFESDLFFLNNYNFIDWIVF